jgi:hypothetical protein
VIGLVLGTFLAEHRVRQLAAEQGQVAPTGLPLPYIYSYHFWFFLVVFVIFCRLCWEISAAKPAILTLDEAGEQRQSLLGLLLVLDLTRAVK